MRGPDGAPVVFDVRRVDRGLFTWHFETEDRLVLGHGSRLAAVRATERFVTSIGGRDVREAVGVDG